MGEELTCVIGSNQVKDIGSILKDTGKITAADLEKIVGLQQEKGMLFGEAAVYLGILTEEDVKRALSQQFSYPYLGDEKHPIGSELVSVLQPFSNQIEVFRSLRSKLVLSGIGSVLKAVAIVSPNEGDGKTFIAANLAATFAQLGSKTVLVDANFRKPRIHEIFNLKNNCGMSSVIIKRANLAQAVYCTPIPTLHILPAGPQPPNPLELLGWPDTRDIITSLKGMYDVIIVDTPAFSNTADALVVSNLVDGILMLALKGNTRKEAFDNVKKQLKTSAARILGSIINEPDNKKQPKRFKFF
ncbi:MAG: polysaccharide biosynthesis tyrosine autokinase [Nitrospirae bacterium]|nr:MAG: polysaccharide biosynthesis tyrosine autokinase [Nitrospirota bacterium]